MEGANKKHISESFRLAAVLALVGGFLDAYTYIYNLPSLLLFHTIV